MASQRPPLRLWKTGSQLARQQARRLTLHQYQSQELLQEAGVKIPQGLVVRSVNEARAAVQELGNNSLVSAQLLKRGSLSISLSATRGLVAGDPEQAALLAAKLLRGSGSYCDRGIVATELYITEPAVAVSNEAWHVALMVDREACKPCIVISRNENTMSGASSSSSSSNEYIASSYSFNVNEGITGALVRRIATDFGLSGAGDEAAKVASLETTLGALSRVFIEREGLLLEVVMLFPRVHDSSSKALITCVDSRFILDDATRARQPALFDLRDRTQEVSDEVEAEAYGLVYVRLENKDDGGSSNNIVGTVVNGAGLALATNDAIGLAGGQSANFLDAGGQATTATMMRALGIVLGDARVRSVLVNIYGGITRCDMIAESMIGAASEMDIQVPVVVRLQGTNSEAGLKLLADANLGIHVESDFGRAAQKAVELAKAYNTRPQS